MIFLNILQNVAIILFKYFVSHIMVIHRADTLLYHTSNQISLSLVSIMGYSGITRDNILISFFFTFPTEVISSLKMF